MENDERGPRTAVRILGAFLGGVVVHGAVAASLPGLPLLDGWFHSRYSELLVRGVAAWDGSAFPWHAHSAYADLPVDWSLGWHWLLGLFMLVAGPVLALRLAVVAFGAALAAAFHALLLRAGTRWPWLWTTALLLGSAGWLFRCQIGRPTTLSVALLLVLLLLVLERRPNLAAATAFVAMLLYHVPATPLLVGGCGCLGLLAADRRIPWRVGLSVLAGVGVAILVHPGFWTVADAGPFAGQRATLHLWGLMRDSIEFAAQNGTVVFPGQGEIQVPLPSELRAPDLATFLQELRVPLLATLAAVAVLVRVPAARRDRFAIGATALAAACLIATWRSGRFFEYWHPFAVAGAALTVGRHVPWQAGSRARTIVLAAVAVMLVSEAPLVVGAVRKAEVSGSRIAPAAAALTELAEPADIVWHGSWDDFAPLFHHAPQLRYLTGFDPWYLVAHDRQDVLHHAAAQAGAFDDAALRASMTERLGARWCVLWKHWGRAERYAGLEAQLRAAEWATLIHEDKEAVVFELEAGPN